MDGVFDEEGGAIGSGESREARGAGLAGRIDFDDLATADGDDGGEFADDEAIAGEEEERLAEADADAAIGEGAGVADDFGGAGVEVDGCAAVEGFHSGEEGQLAIDDRDGAERAGGGEHHAAGKIGVFDAGEVDGGALAGVGGFGGSAVDLDAADAEAALGGLELHFLFRLNGAGGEGAGDDGAEALHGEGPIDGEAERLAGGAAGSVGGESTNRQFEFVEAGAGAGADGDDGGAFEERAGDKFFGFELDEFDYIGVDRVCFGDDDDALFDAEEATDVEVLASLGLDGFVGGDDEENDIDTGDAGDHGFDEALMTGDIDEAGVETGAEIKMGEAEFDGDAAALFFGEAIGVHTGECPDEGGFSVIYVSGGSEDNG